MDIINSFLDVYCDEFISCYCFPQELKYDLNPIKYSFDIEMSSQTMNSTFACRQTKEINRDNGKKLKGRRGCT